MFKCLYLGTRAYHFCYLRNLTGRWICLQNLEQFVQCTL